MLFALGFLAGICLSILLVSTLAYFRRVIEHQVNIVEKQIDIVGPRPKGFVIVPPDEADEAREQIIEENRKQGRDTKIEELI